MNEQLWARAESKVAEASQHYVKMGQALVPPRFTGALAAAASSGAIIGGDWQQPFCEHLNGFLASARSVPWIIEANFGADCGHKDMRDWFKALPGAEQERRHTFRVQFKPLRKAFDALLLTKERDMTLHRIGAPSVEVTVRGHFGKTYTGAPNEIPTTEIRGINVELPLRDDPVAVPTPKWTDFKIARRPLFPECEAYLEAARKLTTDARAIAAAVHGTDSLTAPPE